MRYALGVTRYDIAPALLVIFLAAVLAGLYLAPTTPSEGQATLVASINNWIFAHVG